MAVNIAIFASGSGSNAENLINQFKENPELEVPVIFCNNPKAFVIERAKKLGVDCHVFDKTEFRSSKFLAHLANYDIDFIVLAGFLWLIPPYLVQAFPDRIINIHPALLPNYGGKGMYGSHVHKAVIQNRESKSGITIHLVNEKYDEGRILHQSSCLINAHDTPETLAEKIHELEYRDFPKIVAEYIKDSTEKMG